MLSGPPINSSVTIEAADTGLRWRTRVEELDDEVVVAAPVLEHEVNDPALGQALQLRWRGQQGPVSMDVTLVAKQLRHLATWRLHPEGPVVITQRRHHTRTGALLPAILDIGSGTLDAHVVDVSEGGVRLVHQGGRRLRAGDAVRLQLGIDDVDLVLTATVVRVDAGGARTSVGLRFLDATGDVEDRIRRYVFSRQAHARRLQ